MAKIFCQWVGACELAAGGVVGTGEEIIPEEVVRTVELLAVVKAGLDVLPCADVGDDATIGVVVRGTSVTALVDGFFVTTERMLLTSCFFIHLVLQFQDIDSRCLYWLYTLNTESNVFQPWKLSFFHIVFSLSTSTKRHM